jgi:fibronectin-binding autotransporter adhesin
MIRRTIIFRVPILAVLVGAALLSAANAAPVIQVGDATVLYTDAQMPFVMDGSMSSLNNGNGTSTFFESSSGFHRYTGTATAPLQTAQSNFAVNMNGYSGAAWLQNIYQVSGGTLLGFMHRENQVGSQVNGPNGLYYAGGSYYYEGLGESTNNGASWTYLGDVLAPQSNGTTVNLQNSNVAGMPYTVANGYLYVYYDEHTGTGPNDLEYPAVARATLSSVLADAASGTVPAFSKYNNGTWTQPGMTGLGSPMIPGGVSTNAAWAGVNQTGTTTSLGCYDVHSGATYCSALGEYLLTVETGANSELLLYTSTNGYTWGNKTVIDYSQGDYPIYSSFAGFDSSASTDSSTVGANFYVYFTRKQINNYGNDTLVSREITIGNGLTWDIGQGTGGASFTGGSGTWISGGNNWNTGSGSAAWSNSTPASATFAGTAGTVTIAGPVTVSGLTFNTSGYVLSGNTLTLGGNAVTANADATIACPLAGSAGLAKTGAGKLTLSGSNVFSGPVIVSAGIVSVAADAALGAVPAAVQTDQITLDGGTLQTTAGVNLAANRGLTITPNGGAFDVPAAGLTTTLNGAISGTGSLAKTGAGMLLLTAASSTAGPITVSGGTLLSSGILSCGSVSVAGGAMFGGMGSAGAASIAAGGVVQGGYANAGSLSLASLTFAGSGTLNLMPTAGAVAAIAVSGVLSTSGAETVNITSSSPLASGTYQLVSYGSLGGAGTEAFVLGTVPAQGARLRTYALEASQGNSLELSVNGDFPIWTGTASSAWDTSTVNWKLAGNGAPTTFYPADSVVFDDNAASKNVSINGANVWPASVTFSNSAGNYVLSGTNGIAGTTSLSKSNNGIVTISNSNTYSGGTNLYGGMLIANAAGALGSGAVNLYGGTLISNSAGALGSGPMSISAGTLIANAAQSPSSISLAGGLLSFANGGLGSGNVAFSGGTLQWATGNTQDISSKINIAGAGQVAYLNTNGNNVTFGTSLSGSGGFAKLGTGALVLNQQDTMTGTVAVNGGTIQTGILNQTYGALGSASLVVVNSGAWITMTTHNAIDGTVTSGTRQLQINAGGTVANFTGGGYTCHLNALVLNGGTLASNGSQGTYGSWNFDWGISTPGNGTTSYITGGNAALNEVGGTVFNIGANDAVVVSSLLAHVSGAPDNGLIKSGAGTLLLTAANTFTGGIILDAGVLNFASGALSTNTVACNGGTLQWAGGNTQDISARINGGIANNGQIAYLNTNGNSITFGTAIGGSGGLDLVGGALTLNALNTYTGGTTVNSGTLTLAAGSAGNGTILGALTINSGATVNANTAWSFGYQSGRYVNSVNINGGLLYFSGAANQGGYGGGSITMTGGTIGGATPFDWYNALTSGAGGTLNLNTNASGTTAVINEGINMRTGSTGYVAFNVAAGSAPSGVDLLVSAPLDYADGQGGATVVKAGPGLMELAGANSYTGSTIINGGVLRAGSAQNGTTSGPFGASGTISFGGGTLQYSSVNAADYSPRFSTAGNQAYSVDTNGQGVSWAAPLISIGGSLTKLGAGTLYLTSSSNSYSGPTTINSGTLVAAAPRALPASSNVNVTGGTLDVTGYPQTVNSLAIGSVGGLNLNDLHPVSVSGTASFASGSSIDILTSGIVTPDLLMTYAAPAGTFTNVYVNGVLGLPAGDSLSYSGGSLEIVSNAAASGGTWTQAAGGRWTMGSNWSSNPEAPTSGTVAFPELSSTSAISVTLDAPQSAGALVFAASEGYTLAPGSGGSLTLGTSAGGSITVLAGTHTISAPLVLAGSADVAPVAGTQLIIGGNIGATNGSQSLTLSDAGILELSGINTNSGGTNILAGTLVLDTSTALADGSSLTVGRGASSLFAPVAGPADTMYSWSAAASAEVVAVPEPGTLALLAVAALLVAVGHFCRKGLKC